MDRAVRLARAEDAGAVAALLDAFNREFGAPTPGPAVLARRLAALLGDERLFGVLIGEPPVGVAVVTLRPGVWSDGGVALLEELYVHPDRRGRGLGSAVLAFVVEEARRRGAAELEIEVDEPDIDAQRFYGRHGLPVADPITGERALVLRRDL